MLDDLSSDLARDAELLRKTVPLMTRHGGGYYPISYAVWYEYAKGDRLQLQNAVDRELTQRARLSHSVTYSLYLQYIVDPAERMILTARASLMEILAELRRNTAQSGQDAQAFGDSLADFQQKLSSATSMDDLASAIAAIQAGAGRMSRHIRELSGQLDRARDNIHSLTEKIEKLQTDVVTDALSGLLNRRGFDRELERAASEAGSDLRGLSMILFDIDHFKHINDTYGHPLGDRVISAVGNAILSCVGSNGVAARYGGEEFAVLLPARPVEDAGSIAEAIRKRVEQGRIRRRAGEESMALVTISAGVAGWEIGDTVESFTERADRALYASKNDGRNRVTVGRKTD